MKSIIILIAYFIISANTLSAQETDSADDIELITETLMHYIEGTANGQPERLEIAFHPDFNLYSINDKDSVKIWSGKDYISNITPGKKSNRIGRIISIDHENNAATAKAEILIPGWRVFTDYFILLKYQGSWKIIQKSYTWRDIPLSE